MRLIIETGVPTYSATLMLKEESRSLLIERLTRMGYTHLSQIRFVRQPMRVGGLWECEVAV